MCTHYGELLGEDFYNIDQRQAAFQSPKADQVVQADSQKPAQQEVIYAQFDGGFIFSDADWREVKPGRVFLKSDCQVVDNEERGNRILRSEYAASLGHYRSFTDKFSVLIQEARRADRKLVFITDGALWMRNWMKENYGDATQILDFFHVCEHLGEFAKEVVSKVGKNHHQRYDRQKQALRQGEVMKVIHRIKNLPLARALARERQGKLLKYFTDNAYRMKYDDYRKEGLMIGSGPIGAAHRTVVQKRMKLSGQRWSCRGAQHMLNLRVAFKSQREIMVRNLINAAA